VLRGLVVLRPQVLRTTSLLIAAFGERPTSRQPRAAGGVTALPFRAPSCFLLAEAGWAPGPGTGRLSAVL